MTLRLTQPAAQVRIACASLSLILVVAACGGGAGGADGGGQPGLGPPIAAGAAGTGENVPADVDVDARAAALLTSCVGDDSAFAFLQRWYYEFCATPDSIQARAGAIACLGKATDGCAAIQRCLGSPTSIGCSGGGDVCPGSLCADTGLSCQMDAPLGTVCAGSGATCNAGGASASFVSYVGGLSCSSGMLTVCVNGHQTTVACSDIHPGFTCQSSGGVSFCGVASQCDPTQTNISVADQEMCSGGDALFCDAGRIEHIACSDLGFQTCQTIGGRSRCGPSS